MPAATPLSIPSSVNRRVLALQGALPRMSDEQRKEIARVRRFLRVLVKISGEKKTRAAFARIKGYLRPPPNGDTTFTQRSAGKSRRPAVVAGAVIFEVGLSSACAGFEATRVLGCLTVRNWKARSWQPLIKLKMVQRIYGPHGTGRVNGLNQKDRFKRDYVKLVCAFHCLVAGVKPSFIRQRISDLAKRAVRVRKPLTNDRFPIRPGRKADKTFSTAMRASARTIIEAHAT